MTAGSCSRGNHPFTPENTRIGSQRPGQRICRTCERDRKASPRYRLWRTLYDAQDRLLAKRAAGFANRRARQLGVVGSITEEDVLAVWLEQPSCVRCGRGVGLDHIVPMSRGGANERSNLQTLCRRCNASKGARMVAA